MAVGRRCEIGDSVRFRDFARSRFRLSTLGRLDFFFLLGYFFSFFELPLAILQSHVIGWDSVAVSNLFLFPLFLRNNFTPGKKLVDFELGTGKTDPS